MLGRSHAVWIPLLVLGACTSPTGFDGDVRAELAEAVPTVVLVSWEANEPAADSAYVVIGDPDDAGSPTAPAALDGTVYRATVLGLKPNTEYRLSAVESVDGTPSRTSPGLVVETGSVPDALPSLSVSIEGPHGGGYLTTSTVSFPSLAVILDRDGDCVWWHQMAPPDGGDWETFYIPRVARTRDGQSVIYEAAMGVENADRERVLVKVSMDGDEVETLPIQNAHHDFAELPDGTIAVLMEDSRPVGDEMIEGDQIVEVDGDGTLTTIWSIWDHAEFDPETQYDPGIGWSHANALQYDEVQDVYHVSLRNFDAVHEIDRASGEVIWTAGGDESDFALAGGDTSLFERQHRFRMLDQGILIFDNRVPEEGSRAVEYTLDESSGTAEVVWEYLTEPSVFSLGFGDVERLDSGNTLVDWSAQGQIDEVTADGELVWRLNSAVGAGFGYMEWFASFYEDAGP